MDANAGESAGLADIVVTAERRSSPLQNTPLAITAVSGEVLANRQIRTVEDLSLVLPSVTINPTLGNGRIAIRGIGLDTTQTGGENRVAFHLDGVYVSRPAATLGTLFDVDRIEVVRGPQGTLYGRNATAGAINVITNDPGRDLGGYARLTYGSYDTIHSEAALNLPVTGSTLLRVAGQTTDHAGYGRNLTTGHDLNDAHTRSARAVLIQKFDNGLTLRLSGDYHRENDANYAFYYLGAGNPLVVPLAQRNGAQTPPARRDAYNDAQQSNGRTFYSGSLTATAPLNRNITFTSITGYRHSSYTFLADADGTSFPVAVSQQIERAHQFSEEVRFAGDFSRGNWIAGLYYFTETVDGRNAFAPLNRLTAGGPNALARGFTGGGTLTTDAYAAFGELHFNLTDTLTLVAGGRYSDERKNAREYRVNDTVTPYALGQTFNLTPTTNQTASWDSFTPRVTLEYKPRAHLLVYATYSQGFKSGGYALGALQPAVKPEKLTDYEFGIKADFLDRRLRANITGYYYDYRNLQVSIVVPTGTQLLNAARAHLKGVDAEITALPIAGVQLDLTATYLDGKYTSFVTADPSRPTLGLLDLRGNRIAQALPYTILLGGQYSWSTGLGRFTVRGEADWYGRNYFNAFNRRELSQPAYSKLNAFVTYESPGRHWTGTLFARNLTNNDTLTFAYTTNPTFGSPIIGTYAPPRTYGVEIGYKF